MSTSASGTGRRTIYWAAGIGLAALSITIAMVAVLATRGRGGDSAPPQNQADDGRGAIGAISVTVSPPTSAPSSAPSSAPPTAGPVNAPTSAAVTTAAANVPGAPSGLFF